MSDRTYLFFLILLWFWFVVSVGSTLERVGLSKSRVGSIVVQLNFIGLIVVILVARRLGV